LARQLTRVKENVFYITVNIIFEAYSEYWRHISFTHFTCLYPNYCDFPLNKYSPSSTTFTNIRWY